MDTVAGAPRPRLGGLVRVLAAAAAMGTLGPVAGVAYGEGVEPATFSALRAVVGTALLGVVLLAGAQPRVSLRGLDGRQRALLLTAAAVNGAMNLALFLAFGAMAVGLVMAVYYAYPSLVAIATAVLGRERLTPRRVAGLVAAGAGIAILLGSRLDPAAHVTAAGLLLAGLAAAGQATYLVAIRGGFDDVPGVQATTVVLAGGIVISGGAAVLLEASSFAAWVASPVAWLAVACAGTLGALPKVWILSGVRLIGSTPAAVAMTIEPVVAVIVAAILLGQWLTPAELAGGAAILVAVVLVQPAGRGSEAARDPVAAGGGEVAARLPNRGDPS